VTHSGEELMCSIIQRAGIIPLSIAGIFKEVTTISISAIVFGDQLTEVNMIGVLIAIIGKSPLHVKS
jgi:solute carrier family 35 protein C2